jgi:hypothetical protein
MISKFSKDSKFKIRSFRKRTDQNEGCCQVYKNNVIDQKNQALPELP